MRSVIDITVKNFAEIRDAVILQWPEFEIKEFSLRCGKSSVTNSTTFADNMEIFVSDDCKGFTDFSECDALKYTSVLSIEENSVIFQQWHGDVSFEVDFLVRDIVRRLIAFDLYSASEYTLREFISPVFVSAVILADFCKLVAEKQITGTLGNGPVDYVAEYCKFGVLLTEAKKEKPQLGVVQNLVQIAASREMFRGQVAGCKRFRDFADDTQNLPSSGIVSTGAEWIFSRYIFDGSEWKFFRSNPLPLTLCVESAKHQVQQWKAATQNSSTSQNTYEDTLKWELTGILKSIVGMLLYQKEKVDEYIIPKKQRTNSVLV